MNLHLFAVKYDKSVLRTFLIFLMLLLLGLTILERPYLTCMVCSLYLPCAILLGRSCKSHMEHDKYTQKLPDALTPALEAVIQLISLSIKDNEH